MIEIVQHREHGDMALCNLASINVVEFYYADDATRADICSTAVKALDLAIEYGICPIEEGQITNDEYKYMGIGITNLANLLAMNKIVIDSAEAAEFIDELMDDLSFLTYRASMLRAKELGAFKQFHNTKWALGETPIHQSLRYCPQAWNVTEYGRNFVKSGKLERWDQLGEDIRKYGIRNAQVMAIAPTANSGKAINATESTEPVMHLMYKEEGVKSIPALAPNIQENHPYYKPAFECDQKALITNAIVRQKYIDQAQSITIYLKKANSLKELTELHNYGFDHGIKTYYYLKQNKAIETGDECVACAV